MGKNIDKRKIIIFLICLVTAFVLLLLNSKCSPLSIFNPRDYQWLLTMGRGVLNGKIPYKDLFEQKGPVVFFVYALIAFTQNPQIATFIFEIICFTFFLYFSYKILRRYSNDIISILFIVLFGVIVITRECFENFGGAVEEYSLPVVSWFILIFLEYFVDGKPLKKHQSFLIGLFVGLIFWSKYIIILVPAVFLLIWLIFSLKNKKFKEFGVSVLLMICGFVLVSVPIIIYFGVNSALYDLFYCYFYINLSTYGSDNRLRKYILRLFTKFNFSSAVVIVFSIFFMVLWVFYFVKHKKEFFAFVAGLVYFIFLLCISNEFEYYRLLLVPFFIFIVLAIVWLIEKFKKQLKYVCYGVSICLIFVFFATSIENGINFANKTEADYDELVVASYISNYGSNSDSLYCYRIKDYGFYNLLGVIPSEKFYAKNIFSETDFPEMYEYFDNVIESQKYFFVITRTDVFEQKQDFLLEYYELYQECGDYVLLTVRG